MKSLWTILVPTLGQRAALFDRLLAALLPQVEAAAGAVCVLAWWNNGSPSLPEIRDGLLAAAETEYVSFFDDDDMPTPLYVPAIVAALASRPDHVGFKIEYTTDGVGHEIVDHSLRHRRWHRNADGMLVRDFTHIDPVRTDIARQGSFRVPRAGRAEDRAWVKTVRGRLVTEAYVDRVLYRYLWRADTTAWQYPDRITRAGARPVVDSPHFAWHPGSDV